MGQGQGRADCCLGMFAKYWQPGSVKTRLAASIGEIAAADVYKSFLQSLLERYACVPGLDKYDPVLVYSPLDRQSDFELVVARQRDCGERLWNLESQCDGDLGARLQHFFGTKFRAGYARVIVTGTDSPTLPTNYLNQAIQLLRWNDVVIGPSEDGGYYLVGVRSQEHRTQDAIADEVLKIFENIEWSSDRVFAQSIQRVQDNALKCAVLPTWYDVDSIEELNRLRDELIAAEAPSAVRLKSNLDATLHSD